MWSQLRKKLKRLYPLLHQKQSLPQNQKPPKLKANPMTHTVHTYSHRLGIIRDWKSRWFGVKNKYKEFLKSDVLLREYLEKKLRGMYVSNIEMERGEKILRIIIETSRPGMIIGRSGDGAVKLKNDILAFLNKHKLSSGGEVK